MCLTPKLLNPRITLCATLLISSDLVAQQAGLFDELTPLYPDSGAHNGTEQIDTLTPRNAVAAVHILVDRLESEGLITVESSLGESLKVYELLPVYVEQNTELHTRTELLDRKFNPHVIRRAPFEIYDPMLPLEDNSGKSDTGGRIALRLELPIPTDAEATKTTHTITLSANSWTQELNWNVQISETTVPELQPDYTNWFSLSNFASYHGHELWSEGHWQTIQQAAELMHTERQTTFWVPWGPFMSYSAEDGLSINSKRLDRYTEIFLDAGFRTVELGHLAHRENGVWGAKHLTTQQGNLRVDSPEGKQLLIDQLELIRAYVEKYDLTAVSLQHISDEPLAVHAADYVLVAELVHQHLPGVPVFDATHCTNELVGAVDVWCPQLDIYHRHETFFKSRIEAGEAVWIYTCLSPGGAELNRLLDQERTRQVLLGWKLVRDGLSGYLHWGLNHYREGNDSYLNTTPQFDDKPKPSRNFLPPGDSHVTYPSPEDDKRLLSSVRLAAHRIGMEDAALLRQLLKANPDKATSLMLSLLKEDGSNDYNVDRYRMARKALLGD